ncbi:MAG: hypothetical protein EOP87_14820 [Verrucomicrobiaceae bacterium]|nr:MAG: hypothetical protein EOP87_14820 [Verrucomicrobiaceae bacterium]
MSGILIDNPAAAFAGNGLFGKGVVIRGFTNGLHSIGGCNIIFRESGLFNNNVGIRIPSLALAHSYRFEQCSLGGLATVLSGSGTSRILQVEDGSFIDLLGCEMGNCTDLAYTAGSAILNVIGGNMESMPGTNNVLITMNGGNVNLSGVRLGAGNRTVVRAFGGTGEILGVSLTGNQAQGAMTMFDHHGIGYADLRGNGLSKTVTEYTDNTFTTIRGSSVCERLVVSARMTANQVIGATGTHTVIFPVEGADVGGKHNTTTGEFAPGKRGNYRFSAGLDVDSGTTAPQLGVYINGSLRATLSQFVTSGGGTGTFVTGSQIVPMGAGDIATIRVVTGGAATIRSSSNYTSMLSIEELPYWN